jgi:hypothetical protein
MEPVLSESDVDSDSQNGGSIPVKSSGADDLSQHESLSLEPSGVITPVEDVQHDDDGPSSVEVFQQDDNSSVQTASPPDVSLSSDDLP